jgi:crooked neck
MQRLESKYNEPLVNVAFELRLRRYTWVEKKMPRRVKRKRPIYTEDGTPAGQEEYYDYIFPEEQGAMPNLKILEAAYKWKRQKTSDE